MPCPSRWIAVIADLCNTQHELHPHTRGQKACDAFAWIDLIGMAAWRDHGGLRRGQVRASQSYLARRWRWSRGKVCRFLAEREEKGGLLREHGTRHEPDILTICNYDAYQTPRAAKGTANGTASGTQDVPVHRPTDKRARARGNRNGRKPPQPADPIDMRDAYAAPEKVHDILEGLKRQVNERAQ